MQQLYYIFNNVRKWAYKDKNVGVYPDNVYLASFLGNN